MSDHKISLDCAKRWKSRNRFASSEQLRDALLDCLREPERRRAAAAALVLAKKEAIRQAYANDKTHNERVRQEYYEVPLENRGPMVIQNSAILMDGGQRSLRRSSRLAALRYH